MATIMIDGKPVLFICDGACKELKKKTAAKCLYTHDINHAIWNGETTLIKRDGYYMEDKPIEQVFNNTKSAAL